MSASRLRPEHLVQAWYDSLDCDKFTYRLCANSSREVRDLCGHHGVYARGPPETGRCALPFALSDASQRAGKDLSDLLDTDLNALIEKIIELDHVRSFLLLIDRLRDANLTDESIIEYACYCNAIGIVRVMLDLKAEEGEKFSKNIDAIEIASEHGHVDILGLLLEADSFDTSWVSNEAIIKTIRFNEMNALQILLDDGRFDLDRNFGTFTPLKEALNNNNMTAVSMLLKYGCFRFSEIENTPGNNAILRLSKNPENIRMLLEDERFDPTDTEHRYLFDNAISAGFSDVVGLLLKDGRVNPSHMLDASLSGLWFPPNYAIARMILEDGRVDPNEVWIDEDMLTDLDFTKVLLADERFDPHRLYSTMFDQLHKGEKVNEEVIRLIALDPRVEIQDKNLALIMMSEVGNVSMVRLLLEDPDVDPVQKYNVPLVAAEKNGRVEVMKLLLEDERVIKHKLDLTM